MIVSCENDGSVSSNGLLRPGFRLEFLLKSPGRVSTAMDQMHKPSACIPPPVDCVAKPGKSVFFLEQQEKNFNSFIYLFPEFSFQTFETRL